MIRSASAFVDQRATGETAPERMLPPQLPDGDVVAVTPEHDLIAGFDAALLAQRS